MFHIYIYKYISVSIGSQLRDSVTPTLVVTSKHTSFCPKYNYWLSTYVKRLIHYYIAHMYQDVTTGASCHQMIHVDIIQVSEIVKTLANVTKYHHHEHVSSKSNHILKCHKISAKCQFEMAAYWHTAIFYFELCVYFSLFS